MEIFAVKYEDMESAGDIKLKTFKLKNQHKPIRWDGGTPKQPKPTTNLTSLGTMPWSLLIFSLLFILASCLLIANGKCSSPHGAAATKFPLCIGGQLSIQSWLAIIGLEFLGFVGLVMWPAERVLVSKLMTRKLMSEGASLAKVLNSQEGAPLKTRVRWGYKVVFMIRVSMLAVMVALSLLYKFSFVKIGNLKGGVVGLEGEQAPIAMGCNEAGRCDGVSTNLLDVLGGGNTASSINITSSSNNTETGNYTQILGPSPSNLFLPIEEGNLTLCTPTFYARNKITVDGTHWKPPPINFTNVAPDGLRFTYDGFLIDILSPNGTLQILTGIFGQPSSPGHYVSLLSSTTQICTGYVSWTINNTFPSNHTSPTPKLQEPTDIDCTTELFNLSSWCNNTGFSTQFTLNTLQALSSSSSSGLAAAGLNITTTSIFAMNLILAAQNHTSSIYTLTSKSSSTNPNKTPIHSPSLCTLPSTQNSTLILSGALLSSSSSTQQTTGFTIPGLLFQILIFIFSVLTLGLLGQKALPLVGEWPAQWLGLVYGVSGKRVQGEVEGTSVGRGWVGGNRGEREEGRVWLGSAGGEVLEGRPYLMLGEERIWVREGRRHV